jgi:hypothetical protein
MDVSIIVPMQAAESSLLPDCVAGILAQRFEHGRVEALVARYGGGPAPPRELPVAGEVRVLEVDAPTPYAARNAAAAVARGDVLLFTEPGCVPAPGWVAAHVERLREGRASVSVGPVMPVRLTRLVERLLAYENVRDEWVFSSPRWQHYFGRPKNMAITRHRFATHGPFVEVARGADSKLVQKIARELSCDEITLTPTAIVRQQTVRGLPSFLRERFGHAHALEVHQSAHAAPIMLADRTEIFRDTVRRNRFGPLQAATLAALLAAGIVTFRAGGCWGTVARKLRH